VHPAKSEFKKLQAIFTIFLVNNELKDKFVANIYNHGKENN